MMKAQEFWSNLNNQIALDGSILESVWDDRTRFTTEIKETIKKAIKGKYGNAKTYEKNDTYQLGDYVLELEYFNIDLVAWEQKKDHDVYKLENGIEKYQLNKHAWNFDIAVEHENASNDWSDEVIKLAYIFCNLRVVIGYFPYVKEGKEEMQQKYLDAISETIKTLTCRENMKHGEFLIILGDVGGNEADGFRKLVYTPYRYHVGTEKFELLQSENPSF